MGQFAIANGEGDLHLDLMGSITGPLSETFTAKLVAY